MGDVLENNDDKCFRGSLRDNGPMPWELCAYRDDSDSCAGDSGGPLVTLDNGRCTIIGVVSRGYGCNLKGYAGIYTRVNYFMDWIYENTKDGGCYDTYFRGKGRVQYLS